MTASSDDSEPLGQIRLYCAAHANCCDRVRWSLDYKRVSYALVDLDQPHDAAHFASISPFGRIPVIEIEGIALTESMAIVELLEELHPSPPLNASDPTTRARVREVYETVNSSIHPVQNGGVVRHFRPELSGPEVRQVRADWIASNLLKVESWLWLNTGFAIGSSFSLPDIFVAAIFQKGLSLGINPPNFQALPSIGHS